MAERSFAHGLPMREAAHRLGTERSPERFKSLEGYRDGASGPTRPCPPRCLASGAGGEPAAANSRANPPRHFGNLGNLGKIGKIGTPDIARAAIRCMMVARR
jgi:hypothetical protein